MRVGSGRFSHGFQTTKRVKAYAARDHSSMSTLPSTIHFATGNKKKLEEVVAILQSGQTLPFKVESVKLELPELQVS